LHTPEAVAQWYKDRPKPNPMPNVPQNANPPPNRGEVRPPEPAQEPPALGPGHDTVTVLALDQKNSLGGVCTTSGLAYKLPGRVGDSPLIGSGLYGDDAAGAAGATGVGEEIIRIGGSFFVVEQMRAGRSPQEACEAAVRRVNATAVRRGVHPARVAFLALDVKGRIGAACTQGTNFQYAANKDMQVELRKAPEIGVEAR
jgi:N4-(beta-N-acetylglucosaminyl)-L-asparaginase